MPDQLRAFVEDNGDFLLKRPSVQSVGIGTDDEGNRIIVVRIKDRNEFTIQEENTIDSYFPQEIDYEIRETGEFVAQVLVSQDGFTGRHRPVPIGASCGHPDVTAGTTGFVYQSEEGTRYVSSNNHVLANVNEADVGDDVLQPGAADGGESPEDNFATLVYYARLQDDSEVDLALARAEVGVENSILGIDRPIKGYEDNIQPGDELTKSGRTTGVSSGAVEEVGASVRVRYGDAGTFTIRDCIITEDMSDGGDSGSATWIDKEDGLYAAGRVFAGSRNATVHHRFLNELNNIREQFEQSMMLMTDGGEEPQPIARVNVTLKKVGNELGTVQCSVRGEREGPLEGADVNLIGPEEHSKTTGAQGVVAFFDVPLGEYRIEFIKEGYESTSETVTEEDFEPPNA